MDPLPAQLRPVTEGRRRTIAVVTTSRADYSHLYWPLRELRSRPEVDLRLVALGSHLAPGFGSTAGQVDEDGFVVSERVECLLDSDSDVGMAKTIGVGLLGLADVLGRVRPDLLLVIADRYELLAPASAALALRIPIAHLEGGEVTEGAIDDAVRNALTKMSHVHLAPTESARRRILAMGEEPWRVHRVGAPSLDHLRRGSLLPAAEIEARLGVAIRHPMILVAHHPLTLARDTLREVDALFEALEALPHQLLFCFPNADAGSRRLVARTRAFCDARDGARLFVNLSPMEYWSLLAQADLFLGNSSSGVMETPSLRIPTVNVGLRQEGRERARNIIDVEARAAEILGGVERGLSPLFRHELEGMENPYGDGRAAERIAGILCRVPLGEALLRKRAPEIRDYPFEPMGT